MKLPERLYLRPVYRLFVVVCLLLPVQCWATGSIAPLLALDKAPPGVIFEIAESDQSDLAWVIPQIDAYVRRLRKRFPDINLAVVSHGAEQFGLMASAEKSLPAVHRIVRNLVGEQKVPLHVCQVNAAWNDIGPEAFPDYVDVAAYGPAQIQDYESLGYVRIRVKRETPLP